MVPNRYFLPYLHDYGAVVHLYFNKINYCSLAQPNYQRIEIGLLLGYLCPSDFSGV